MATPAPPEDDEKRAAPVVAVATTTTTPAPVPSPAPPTPAVPAPAAPAPAPARQVPRDYVLVDPALRQRAIDLVVKERWTISDAARAIGIKASTLYKSIERFKKGKSQDASARPRGRPPVLSEDHTKRLRGWAMEDRAITTQALTDKARAEFGFSVSLATVRRATMGLHSAQLTDLQEARVREWLDEDCALTLKALAAKVQSELGVSVTISAVRRAMRGLHFSLKRWSAPPVTPEQWNSSEAIEARFEYGMEYIRLLSKRSRFVFLDEVQYSYSLRSRLNASVAASAAPVAPPPAASGGGDSDAAQPIVRSQPFSVAAAVMESKLVMYKVRQGEYTELSFESVIVELADALRRAGVIDAVIVLNAAYKTQALEHRDVVGALGHTLLFLPPDSPFLNPAESFFADWTQLVRRGPLPATERDLLRLIECATVSPEDCAKYFRMMESYIHPSITKNSVVKSDAGDQAVL
ncbi:Transposase [Globisporangium polare]